MSVQLAFHKGYYRNRAPFKSGIPGWQVPSGMNNNLVISFSDDDDDSGSDSEQQRHEKALTSARNFQTVNVSKKSPTLPPLKLRKVPRAANSDAKAIPRKGSLGRTSISSMNKLYGTHSGNVRPSLVDQRSNSKNINLISRFSATHDDENGKTANLNDSRLQDLRQKIAIRENELKLKTVQQSTEILSESFRDSGAINQKAVTRRCEGMSADAHIETDEREAKRLRVAKKTSGQPSSGSQEMASARCMPLLNEHPLDNNGSQDGNLLVQSDNVRELSQTRVQSSSMGMPIIEGRHSQLSKQSFGAGLQHGTSMMASCSLSDWASRPRDAVLVSNQASVSANVTAGSILKSSNGEKCEHATEVVDNHPLGSAPNIGTALNNSGHDTLSGHDKFKATSDSNFRMRFVQDSPEYAGLLKSWGRSNILGSGEVDVQSFLEIEEFHDKELEEAQEYRRRCEIEERNALKAYRKAQRALAEANAHCACLYRRRELYSAQLRSFMMDESNIVRSSGQHGQIRGGWNPSNNVSEVNLDLVPNSIHQRQGEFHAVSELGYHSHLPSGNDEAHNRFSPNLEGQHLGSEACSEPDASTTELLPLKDNNAANGVLSPSSDPNISVDEDEETFPSNHVSVQVNTESLGQGHFRERESDVGSDLNRNNVVDESHDPLVLEAYLRSKLVSRLGTRTSFQKCVSSDDREVPVGTTVENHVESLKTQKVTSGALLSDPGRHFGSDNGDNSDMEVDRAASDDVRREETRMTMENSLLSDPINCRNPEVKDPVTDAENSGAHLTGDDQSTSASLPSPNIRSVFNLLTFVPQVCSIGLQTVNQIDRISDWYIHDNFLIQSSKSKLGSEEVNCSEEVMKDSLLHSVGSYSCSSKIDPFWPLCSYELRGKCNNNECPWQHVKDCSGRDLAEYESSGSADQQSGLSSNCRKEKVSPKDSCLYSPPTYLVSVDGLKPDSHSYCPLSMKNVSPCWRKVFSVTMAMSSSLHKHLASDEPILHGNDGCAEPGRNMSRQSLYFQSRNHIVNLLQNGVAEKEQMLEMALLALNQEVNKLEGMKKSLTLLSRALEADSASTCLWIVYLSIYYSDKNLIGEDDLCLYAVQHNGASYELWLMYINSRVQLTDKIAAYERALSTMCSCTHTADWDLVYASACILDIFLQMLYCLSMSGNVGKAIQKLYGLVHTREECDSSSLLLSDILPCLTLSDKCIFWVCSMYLVVYRELPNEVVLQFEFEKQISLIEWPSVQMTVSDKQRANKLMALAVESVSLHENSFSQESETACRSAYLFALSHIKLVEVLDGIESCKNLLDQYMRMYPSCLELVLLSARSRDNESDNPDFVGFKEALTNWPKEIPGLQCLWNQYAEHALNNGRLDTAKEIMAKWFDSVRKIQCPEHACADIGINSQDCLENIFLALNSEEHVSNSKKDLVFGLLNLSLHMVMQNDIVKAHSTMDKALRVAGPDDFRHWVKEHSIFVSNYGSQVWNGSGLLQVLSSYVAHARGYSMSEPLTRHFVQNLKKPRLRQLITNLFSPISLDFSVVNMVLGIWFGPSLLPRRYDNLKNIVDFVEAVLEISPANYPLAISVCKLLNRDSDAGDMRSASFCFWASSVLVNTIYQAIPIAPECVWVEAAGILGNLFDTQAISESFHRRGLAAYPFSIRLWKSFQNLCVRTGNSGEVVQAARERGIELTSNGQELRDQLAFNGTSSREIFLAPHESSGDGWL